MSREKTFALIKELTQLQAVSGNESSVRSFLKEKMTPLVDEVEITGLGNIFGIKKGSKPDGPKIMIAAHMDEVGFMTESINENGTLNVVALGGWNVYAIPAQRFTLHTQKGDYPCVSAVTSPHLLKGGQSQLTVEDILFDAGFKSREEAQEYGVQPGDFITPDTETVLGANGDSVMGKAWDNRYGCTLIVETLQLLKDQTIEPTLIIGASVQEEVGLRGIKGAVTRYQPDVFIAVDCSPAGDTNGDKSAQGQLGEGFLLRIQDPSMISDPRLINHIRNLAEENNINYQHFFSKGGTDAAAAHVMNEGIPSCVIGVPARYIHSHQAVYSLSDYEAAREVLYKFLKDKNLEKLTEWR